MGSLISSAVLNIRHTLNSVMRAFILLAVLALAYGERIKGTFEVPNYAEFKAKWNKSYTAVQEDAHYNAYLKNVEFINNHNAEYDEGKHTFWCGVNEWSDMTDEEYEARNGYRLPTEPIQGPVRNGDPATSPDSVDWRTQGAVNYVKNQGQCGSCWAFSAVCALEGQWAIHKGSLPDCGEQQLVSCDPSSHGCSGGWPSRSYDYISGQGSNGIDTQSSYPYTASDSSCDYSKTQDGQNVAATCTGPHSVGSSEGALQEAVGNVGPISICLCASSSAFGQYSGGIFDDASCGTSINHAVACVGYDTNQNYWIVRNSWGTSWGESGYIRMVKGKNMCGMLSNSCYPGV